MRTLLLYFTASLSLVLHGATYHVSMAGSNGNNGLTIASAWATIQHAADVIAPGDTVLVQDGDYTGFNYQNGYATMGDPTVFAATSFNTNITAPCTYNNLDGINVENVAWVVVDGFNVAGMPRTGVRTALSDHVTIRNNKCINNGVWGILTGFAEHCVIEYNDCSASEDEHGIYFGNSADDPIIRYNECVGNNANGIHMNGDASLGGDGVISNAQVYGNAIFYNGVAGGSGINCDGVVNSVIYNNLLINNHASGISLYQIDGGAPSTGNKVYNNTILNATDARWCVNITDLCTNNEVLNNILINQHPWRGSIVIAADALPGFISDHNIVVNSLSPDGDATIYDLAGWQALGYDANSLVAAPLATLFMDPVLDDYRALDASSQQVDAGTSAVSAVVTVDLLLEPRPLGLAYDLGCYESDFTTGLASIATESVIPTITIMGNQILINGCQPGNTLTILDPTGRVINQWAVVGASSIPVTNTGPMIAVVNDAQGVPLASLKFGLLP